MMMEMFAARDGALLSTVNRIVEAMALAKLGEPSALPILLMLVDDNDDLVKSRAVDGLLEFIHEPVVEQKLRLMVLQASNEQSKYRSRIKPMRLKALLQIPVIKSVSVRFEVSLI